MKAGKGTMVLEEKRAPLAARIVGIAVVLVLAGVLVVWGVDLGRRIMGASQGESLPDVQQQLDAAQLEITRLSAERDALQAALTAAGIAPPAVDGAAASASTPALAPAVSVAASAASAASAAAPVAGTAASGTITALPK